MPARHSGQACPKRHELCSWCEGQPARSGRSDLWFDATDAGKLDRPHWADTQTEKDRGRIETRRCLATNDVAWLQEQKQHWSGLNSLIIIESTREIIGSNGTDHPSTERRYYISCLPAEASLLGKIVRAHCGIENSMHWMLDAGRGVQGRRLLNPGRGCGTKLRDPASHCSQPAQERHHRQTRRCQQAPESRLECGLAGQVTGLRN